MAKNKKQNQTVSANTLIVGIDIGKYFHWVYVMFNGEQITIFKLFNSGHAFTQCLEELHQLKKKVGAEDILIGMEPTGHYWYPLAHFLQARKQPFVQVNPAHVHWSKELADHSPLKTDRKDAGLIAQLVHQGRFQAVYLPKGDYAHLRKLVAMRYQKMDKISAAKNILVRILDVIFPEFKPFFSDLLGKTSLALLRTCPAPTQMQTYSLRKLTNLIQKASHRRLGKVKAEALLQAAQSSIGVTEALESHLLELAQTLDEIQLLQSQLQQIEARQEKHLHALPEAVYLLSIPGIGPMSAASILGETGPLKHFQVAEELIKLAGLNLFEISSGIHQGRRKITKRGRARLRRILYCAIFPLINHNPIFKEAYQTFKEKGKPTQKAIIALCSKLLRILFALVKKEQLFDLNPPKPIKKVA